MNQFVTAEDVENTMKAREDHEWKVTPTEARAIQRRLAAKVSLNDVLAVDHVRIVAGVDNGYVKRDDGWMAYAATVLLSFPALDLITTSIGEHPVEFPYVPGLLTFREGPAILASLASLDIEPDVILFDGHGYAHPRRMGLASHMGVVLDHPAIGCAKSRLTGAYEEPADEFGATSPLVVEGEVSGAALRTLPGHDPLFISPGHKLSVATAVAIALACCRAGEFMPIPTRAAHDAVTAYTRPLRKRR